MIKSKLTSQVVCIFIYVVSFYLSYLLLPESITDTWLKVVVWHIFATIFIYIGSLILNNSSLYDPFWSIAPVPIVVYLTLSFKNTIELIVLVSLPIFFWAIARRGIGHSPGRRM